MKLDNNSIHYCTQCHDEEDESIATHYCNNCNKHLCNLHLQLHNKKKQNKDHNLTNLLPEQQQEEEKEATNKTFPSFTLSNTNNKEKPSSTTTLAPSSFSFKVESGASNPFAGFDNVTKTTTKTNPFAPTTNGNPFSSDNNAPPLTRFGFGGSNPSFSFSATTSTSPISNNITTTSLEIKHYCKVHKELETDIYCIDCDEEICSKCALFKHKLHEVIDSCDIVKEEDEKKMKKLFEDLKSKKEVLLQRTNNVKLSITKVNEQATTVRNEINELFNELQQLLNEKKEKLTFELDEIVKDKLNTLQNEETLLNEHNIAVNDLCQLKVDNLNKINILQNKIKFEKKVNDLNELNVIDNLEFMSNFKLKNGKQDFINLINNKLDNLNNYKINTDKLLFKNKEQVNNDFNLIKFEEIAKFDGNENIKLNSPNDIIYNNNLIYIADTFNNRVLILDNLFNYKNEIKLNFCPVSLELNNKYLYIGCYRNIYKYNLNTLQLINEIESNENYELKSVNGMTLDKDNNLYICNEYNNEIIILNENNEFIRKFKTNNNLQPKRITINNKDQIVITFENEIQIFDKLGNFILNVKFNNVILRGIICDDLNNYIVCNFYGQLLFLDSNFNLIKEIKKNFKNPIDITLDKTNNQIYVLNSGYINGFINFFK